jgi:hypothetical protein
MMTWKVTILVYGMSDCFVYPRSDLNVTSSEDISRFPSLLGRHCLGDESDLP